MADDDVLLPTYREQGAQLWRGVTLEEMLYEGRGHVQNATKAVR